MAAVYRMVPLNPVCLQIIQPFFHSSCPPIQTVVSELGGKNIVRDSAEGLSKIWSKWLPLFSPYPQIHRKANVSVSTASSTYKIKSYDKSRDEELR